MCVCGLGCRGVRGLGNTCVCRFPGARTKHVRLPPHLTLPPSLPHTTPHFHSLTPLHPHPCTLTPALPHSHQVLHGDPFFDNVHVDEAGQFVGWVDWEDASTGPLLFDLACMCIGCCFRSEDNALDLDRLRAILEGYSSKRAITPSEVRRFVPFMRLTLLCNCEWRFRNFNIDHPEMEDNKDRCVRRVGVGMRVRVLVLVLVGGCVHRRDVCGGLRSV